MSENKVIENKVIGLRGAVPACGEPVEDVVDKLKELLKKAEEGELTGIAVAYVGRADTTSTLWCGHPSHQAMITAVSSLWFRMMSVEVGDNNLIIDDNVPPPAS